ncbi:uncharacterized protein [Ptychodera flava]|uniref:uncharacterized protein n=1 Tax=Ptychodera flava TaxID=63121 RepID=UPI00396A4FB8
MTNITCTQSSNSRTQCSVVNNANQRVLNTNAVTNTTLTTPFSITPNIVTGSIYSQPSYQAVQPNTMMLKTYTQSSNMVQRSQDTELSVTAMECNAVNCSTQKLTSTSTLTNTMTASTHMPCTFNATVQPNTVTCNTPTVLNTSQQPQAMTSHTSRQSSNTAMKINATDSSADTVLKNVEVQSTEIYSIMQKIAMEYALDPSESDQIQTATLPTSNPFNDSIYPTTTPKAMSISSAMPTLSTNTPVQSTSVNNIIQTSSPSSSQDRLDGQNQIKVEAWTDNKDLVDLRENPNPQIQNNNWVVVNVGGENIVVNEKDEEFPKSCDVIEQAVKSALNKDGTFETSIKTEVTMTTESSGESEMIAPLSSIKIKSEPD